ncbi:hypothetical protein [Bradyrhizobium australafricanum]|uniref:hypothetical protein n=1 Tax=Bradyrhizobium australafricanum TaxID=2821406 RepID=UPI001CE3B372|nr:hypothetical protein [Bradyrhizobium australafricanum]MCA6102807.1 hypothetical protein [Bradyrhizobium australafricanum]
MRITDMSLAAIAGSYPIAPLTFAARPRIRNLGTVWQIDGWSYLPAVSDDPYQPGTRSGLARLARALGLLGARDGHQPDQAAIVPRPGAQMPTAETATRPRH